ncbi:MAG: hypothetical protein JWR23_1934 [Mucilaginibacter sp.]|nr:hypothetical protein [Mucilaginibacter sp.]
MGVPRLKSGPRYPLIRREALGAGPVSVSIANAACLNHD